VRQESTRLNSPSVLTAPDARALQNDWREREVTHTRGARSSDSREHMMVALAIACPPSPTRAQLARA
jgi:hypothetical protein